MIKCIYVLCFCSTHRYDYIWNAPKSFEKVGPAQMRVLQSNNSASTFRIVWLCLRGSTRRKSINFTTLFIYAEKESFCVGWSCPKRLVEYFNSERLKNGTDGGKSARLYHIFWWFSAPPVKWDIFTFKRIEVTNRGCLTKNKDTFGILASFRSNYKAQVFIFRFSLFISLETFKTGCFWVLLI